jgi:hypothetical protein
VLSGEEVVMDVTVPSDAGGAVRILNDTLLPLYQYCRATSHWSNRNSSTTALTNAVNQCSHMFGRSGLAKTRATGAPPVRCTA